MINYANITCIAEMNAGLSGGLFLEQSLAMNNAMQQHAARRKRSTIAARAFIGLRPKLA